MKYFNLMNISLSQLVIFQTAANLKHFTKTAAQLSVTQPTVSKSISNLEQELGVQLFSRSKNHTLKLTPAGQCLYDYCSQLIPDLHQVFNRMQIIASSDLVHLRIGANTDARNEDYLLPIVKRFGNHYTPEQMADAQVLVRLMPCAELIRSVRDGNLDAVIICNQEINNMNSDDLCVEKLISVPMVAYVQSSSPLFDKETLSIDDIADHPLILLQAGRSHNTQTDNLVRMLHQRGQIPNVGIYVTHPESIGFNLCLGKGLFLADEFFHLPYNPEVKAFYLHDVEESGLSIVYQRHNLSTSLKDFIKISKDYFANEYTCPFHIFG